MTENGASGAKRQRQSVADDDLGSGVRSLSQPISPPGKRRKHMPGRSLVPSPFQLTTIRDLATHLNEGAVSLNDILGDPLIAECWQFNYLHDINFIMRHFDEDTKSLVNVHVVHGFWKSEDPNRAFIQEQASQYQNVTVHTAYMPEIFGTHHTKMMILLRHDDLAQVVIHTANMIAKDWTNMTNGMWKSPLLPLLPKSHEQSGQNTIFGSGERFKMDLLNYLRAYNTRRDVCKSLVDEVSKYDFSAVRAVLVGSVPGRHSPDIEPSETLWGWRGLKDALKRVPSQTEGRSEIVAQISSIATLGPNNTWLNRALIEPLSATEQKTENKPDFKIVFPTPDEIRCSLDGYAAGGSIHMKIQSAQQVKQLQYMRPYLCHWANDTAKGVAGDGPNQEAGRKRAAPHIKTYIRYNSSVNSDGQETKPIDWALLTSANISKQAWGELPNTYGEMRIASWELGVLVWPALLAGGDKTARMVGTFKTDVPTAPETTSNSNSIATTSTDTNNNGRHQRGVKDADDRRHDIDKSTHHQKPHQGPLVGLRIPYNLPLKRYADDELPWVATAQYHEPDWMGVSWNC